MSGVFLPSPSPKYSTRSLNNAMQVLNRTEEAVEKAPDYISELSILVTFIPPPSEEIL